MPVPSSQIAKRPRRASPECVPRNDPLGVPQSFGRGRAEQLVVKIMRRSPVDFGPLGSGLSIRRDFRCASPTCISSLPRNDFTKIKNIRNAFAHAPRSLSFETPEIAGECEKLRYIDATAQNPKRTILRWKPLVGKSPRERFMATVRAFILDLHVAGSKGEKAERHIEQLGGMP
jgi:hypothetical protein